MRNAIRIAAAALLLISSAVAFGQDKPPDVYVKTLPIAKIYTYPQGYRILYFLSTMEYADLYVPFSWVAWSGTGKAEVVWDTGPEFPYMSIYWQEGKFKRIRLYLQSDPHHTTWGVGNPDLDLSRQFSVQEPPKQF